MSQLNPTFGHGNLAYPAHIYSVGGHASGGLMALRDTLVAIALSVSVITGINLGHNRQPSALGRVPAISSQSSSTPTSDNQTTPPASVPAVVAEPTQPDSADLQAILDKWQADYPTAKFGVVARELGGSQRSASLNADMSFEGASLYKLYLADYLYTNIADQKISPDEYLGATRTVGSCLDLMIVDSENDCAESIGYSIGWGNIHNFVRNSGFTETTETPVNTTTATDLANYLERLQGGTLIDSESTDSLLNNMRNQVFRSGIPAGDTGLVVADKVGYIDDYWHDAAIVYGSKGTYVLVVLSQNSGDKPIKDLAGRVNDFMSQ